MLFVQDNDFIITQIKKFPTDNTIFYNCCFKALLGADAPLYKRFASTMLQKIKTEHIGSAFLFLRIYNIIRHFTA